jgi:hypothetical protein
VAAIALPRIPGFPSVLRSAYIRSLRRNGNIPPQSETRAVTHCDFIAKVFGNGNVARTGFAQIDKRACRTVSELCPGEERNHGDLCRFGSSPTSRMSSRILDACIHRSRLPSTTYARTLAFFFSTTRAIQVLEEIHNFRAIFSSHLRLFFGDVAHSTVA